MNFEDRYLQIKKLFEIQVGVEVKKEEEIQAGGNNRLFYWRGSDGREFLAKVYRVDNRPRWYNEITALRFLSERGFEQIPKVIWADKEINCAVLSYERGRVKKADETDADDARLMAEFLAKIVSIDPASITIRFDNLVTARFNPGSYISQIQRQLSSFAEEVASPQVHPLMEEFARKNKVGELIDRYIHNVREKVGDEELNAIWPTEWRRLGYTDLGADNMIQKPDGQVCFVDFEYFGWGNPLGVAADYINHFKTLKVKAEVKKVFLQTFLEVASLPEELVKKVDLILVLDLVGWLGNMLYWMSAERRQVRKEAIINFNEEAYINEKIDSFWAYVELLRLKGYSPER